MEQFNYEVLTRSRGTDSVLHDLRKNGYIPGILYGGFDQNQLIQMPQKEFSRQIKKHGKSGIFQIAIGDEQIPVKINEIQRDPVDGQIIHVDLQRIEMDKQVVMSVPLHFYGQSIGEKNGGAIQQQLRELYVRALPASIPEYIQVNISDMDIGNALHVRDILFPDGVDVQHDLDAVILTILPAKMSLEEAENQSPKSEPEIVNARDSRGIDAAK